MCENCKDKKETSKEITKQEIEELFGKIDALTSALKEATDEDEGETGNNTAEYEENGCKCMFEGEMSGLVKAEVTVSGETLEIIASLADIIKEEFPEHTSVHIRDGVFEIALGFLGSKAN